MIKPTNGRVVLFTPSNENLLSQKYLHLDPLVPMAAHVVHVWTDRLVNLMVLDSIGIPRVALSVPLLQDDDAKPEGGYFATWMDYQKGQAAKYDELAAKAALKPGLLGQIAAGGLADEMAKLDASLAANPS